MKHRPPTQSHCPRCGASLRVHLPVGEVCPQCLSAAAWSAYGDPDHRLVITPEAIESALAERDRGDRDTPVRRFRDHLPGLVALTAALAGAAFVARLFQDRSLGPLRELRLDYLIQARWAAVCGAAALALGVVALVRSRRAAARWPRTLVAAAAVVLGSVGLAMGALNWVVMETGFGWEYDTIPGRPARVIEAPFRAIADATAVITTMGTGRSLYGLGIGTGALVRSDSDRTWIVTSSHVVFPGVAAGARRRPEAAGPVWVYFADGRDAPGRLVWAAPPPLDAAMVEVEIEDPPAAVPLAEDVDAIGEGTPICFVPNPMRAGWLFREGEVLTREMHLTPAGRYSLFYTDLPLQPGDSGSGLFDLRGRLIGLNTWVSLEEHRIVGISLPATTLNEILSLDAFGGRGAMDESPRGERP